MIEPVGLPGRAVSAPLMRWSRGLCLTDEREKRFVVERASDREEIPFPVPDYV